MRGVYCRVRRQSDGCNLRTARDEDNQNRKCAKNLEREGYELKLEDNNYYSFAIPNVLVFFAVFLPHTRINLTHSTDPGKKEKIPYDVFRTLQPPSFLSSNKSINIVYDL